MRPTAKAIPKLTLRAIGSTGVELPMTVPLGTSRGIILKAALLLIDVETEEGITGRSYLFCYVRDAAFAVPKFLDVIQQTVKGEPVAPVDLWSTLSKRFTLIGVQGIVRMAMSGFDVACWDALAQSVNLPLASLIGGKPKRIPAYNSNGLGLMPTKALADEAEKLAKGFRAVKLRLGYPTLKEDIAALHAVRKRIGEDFAIMVDYNQALSGAEALRRGRALDALPRPAPHAARVCSNSR